MNKHKHRVKPGHIGGTYEPSNVVVVEVNSCIDNNVSSHSIWHFCNWQLWGRAEDFCAWKGLAGQWGKDEVIAEMHKEGVRKAVEKNRKNKTGVFDPEIRMRGAKAGAEFHRKNKTGLFDPSCRIQKLGGIAGLKKQIEKNPEIQRERAAKGRQRLKELRQQGLISISPSISISITKEQRQEWGRKSASALWKDPDHPELGHRTATALHRMQTNRGYPNKRENRIPLPE